MTTGMLWFDNDNKTDLPTKIERAAEYYQKKYGKKPDLCFVHPSMIGGTSPNAVGIQVKTTNNVLPHHLWLGVQENAPTR
jgi:hypothetical protein